MMVRALIAFLWLIVLGALASAMRLPKASDIYIKDIYVPVSRATAIVLILVVFVLPLLAFTIKVLRSTHN
jgi:hypothetical protein